MTYQMNPDRPASRSGRAELDALSAALWSSTDADRLFAIVRPWDFHPLDDTIAAAALDLRRQQITWSDPAPVIENLRAFQDLWKRRVDSGMFGEPKLEVPVADSLDPDRMPLRFAGRALQTCRVYDVMRHIPETDLDTAAKQVAAGRRREVAEATMRTVHRIVTTPDPNITHAERQQAVGKIVRDYRHSMVAAHLYPRGHEHGPCRDEPGICR